MIMCIFFYTQSDKISTIKVMNGHYQMLEKGPLTALLGGEELLRNLSSNTESKNDKNKVLALICLWCGIFHICLSYFKKIKLLKLNDYSSTLKR